MKNYDHIVINYLIKNKSRSIAIILSIALSMALVVGVGILSYSARQADIDKLIYESGRGHVSYTNVTPQQLARLKAQNSVINEMGIYSYYGVGHNQNNGTYLACADPGYMHLQGIKVLEGRFPRHTGEIALEKWSLNELGLKPQLDQKIYLVIDYQGQKQPEEFRLVGILKDSPVNKAHATMEGLLSLEQVRPDRSQKLKVYLEFKPGIAILPAASHVAHKANIAKTDVYKNTILLDAMHELGEVDWSSIGLGILVFLIATFVISNIYGISIYRRVQDYGMLRAIGATNSQVGWLIGLEIFILLLVGIPLGIVIGLAGAHCLSGLAGNLFTEGEVHIKGLVITWQPIITGSIAVSLAIVIAGMRTALMVFRISPLEAMRKMGLVQDEIKPGIGKVTAQLGVTHKIVWQHLRNNKKSVALTIISMTIGSVLLMAAAMFGILNKTCMEQKLQASNFRSDFLIYTSIIVPMEQGYSPRQIQAMEDICGVKRVTPVHVWYSQLVLENDEELDQAYFDYLNDLPYYKSVLKGALVKDPELQQLFLKNNLWGYTDAGLSQLKPYLIEGEIDKVRMEREPLAILYIPRPLKKPVFAAQVGDTVTLRLSKPDGQYLHKDFTVAGIVVQMPFTDCFYTSNNSVDIIIPEKEFVRLVGYDTYRIINIDKYRQAETSSINQQLRKITSTLPKSILLDLYAEKAEIQMMNKQIQLFLYAIIIVLFLVALLNIINSINYTFLSRIKEFGLMRAVGLTRRQLRFMILFEGTVYGCLSIILSCGLGTAVQYVIYTVMNPGNIDYPVLGEIYAAVGLINLAMPLLATGLSGYSLTKKDVLESVREFE